MDSLRSDPNANLLLQGLSLFGSGIVAGVTFYITAIELPARQDMPIKYQLENYHQVFPRAAAFMKPFGMAVTGVTGLTLRVTNNKTWWIPTVLIGLLGPFTANFIVPTNDLLMGTKLENAEKVKGYIQNWGELHNVRTLLCLFGFAGACAAALGIELLE